MESVCPLAHQGLIWLVPECRGISQSESAAFRSLYGTALRHDPHVVRAPLQRSKAPVKELAAQHGLKAETLARSRKGALHDAPTGPTTPRSAGRGDCRCFPLTHALATGRVPVCARVRSGSRESRSGWRITLAPERSFRNRTGKSPVYRRSLEAFSWCCGVAF